MRCTKCKRPTKGHKKPTGRHCSLLPIVSDVVEESHKGTNTNGISPDMKRREQHRKQYIINKSNIVRIMKRREQRRKQYQKNKANIVHIMKRRDQNRKQYKINKANIVHIMRRRDQNREQYKINKANIVHIMRRREQKREQYKINKDNIAHIMRRREQKREQYKINKAKMVGKEVSPEQVMKRREQRRNYYKMRKTQIKKEGAKNAYVAWNNTSQTMDSPTVDVFTIPRMSKICCKCGALMFPFEKHIGNLGSKHDIDDTGQASFSLCCSYGRLVMLIIIH